MTRKLCSLCAGSGNMLAILGTLRIALSGAVMARRRLIRYETPVEISFISRIMRFHAVPVSGGLEGAVRSGERPSALGELSRFSIAQASYVFTSRQLER